MTPEQARELLGLAPSDDASAVRRAYLRTLKKHKPERDPEGFRRVRDAYELLREERLGSDRSDEGDVERLEPLDGLVWARRADEQEEEHDRSCDEGLLAEQLALEDPKPAARQVTTWLLRAMADVTTPRPPLGVALDLLIALMVRRAFKTALALRDALVDYLEHVGAHGDARWVLADLLWRQRKELPAPLFAAMAQAVGAGDVTEVRPAFAAFRAEFPEEAARVRRQLEFEAPPLAQVFGGLLVSQTARQPEPVVEKSANGVKFLLIVCGVGAFFARQCQRDAPTAEAPPPVAVVRSDTAVAWEFESEASLRGYRELASCAEAVGDALGRGDCTEARAELKRLSLTLAQVPSTDAHHFTWRAEALRRHVASQCPGVIP